MVKYLKLILRHIEKNCIKSRLYAVGNVASRTTQTVSPSSTDTAQSERKGNDLRL